MEKITSSLIENLCTDIGIHITYPKCVSYRSNNYRKYKIMTTRQPMVDEPSIPVIENHFSTKLQTEIKCRFKLEYPHRYLIIQIFDQKNETIKILE